MWSSLSIQFLNPASVSQSPLSLENVWLGLASSWSGILWTAIHPIYIYIEYIKKTSICRKKEWGICSSHWFRSVTRSYCREVIKAPWCGFVITSLYPLTLSSAHSPRFALWVLRYPLSSVTISDVDMPSLGTALLLQSILVRLGAWELLQGVIRYRVFSLTWVGISLAVQFSYKIHRSSVFLLLVIP